MSENKDGPGGDESVATDRQITASQDQSVESTQTPSNQKTHENKKKSRRLLRDVTKLQPIQKSKSKRKRKASSSNKVFTVDTSRAKSSCDAVRLAIRELKWREFPSGNKNGCDIYWVAGCFENIDTQETGYINKFPGMMDALHKVELTRQLNRMKLLFPKEYSFYPKSWIVPEQFAEISAYSTRSRSQDIFILKPDAGSQGEGIILTNNPQSLCLTPAVLTKPSVVQVYVAEPFLIEKLKFDLRVYVVVKSLEPLEFYICREGLARFCTERYQKPTSKNLHKCFMHLTNYSLNKRSTNYVQSDADDSGSKRKISSVFKLLNEQGCDVNKVWKDIDDLVCKTIIAVVPALKLEMHIATAELKKQLKCFQILGFDILLDTNLKPYLLEVNSSPSLRIDYEEELNSGRTEFFLSTTDLEIKLPVIKDSMKLVCNKTRPVSIVGDIGSVGCLDQLYPKRAKQFEHLHILERCLVLFRHFVGIRPSTTMGASSFRMLARKCMLTDFGFTLAAIELLFIAVARRYWAYDAGKTALNFHGFCDALLAVSQRKVSMPRRSMHELLLCILEHCEFHVEKAPTEIVRKPSRMLNKRTLFTSNFSYLLDAKLRHQSSIKNFLQDPLI